MIDINLIRENKDLVKENIKKKFQDEKLSLVDEVYELDIKYRECKTKADNLRSEKNNLSDKIGELMRSGQKEEANTIKEKIALWMKIDRKTRVSRIIQGIGTFILIDFTWIFFRADGFRESLEIIKQMITIKNIEILLDGTLYECGLNQKNFMLMIFCIVLLFVADFCKYKDIRIRNIIMKQNAVCQILVISGAVLLILLFGIYGLAHDAANFIYFQF